MKILNFKNRQGTALLVALLVMAVLISISLALSTLILRETRITREFLDAGQAYYSAESGIELALYNLKNKLPGWQPVNDVEQYSSYQLDGNMVTVGEVNVKNRCKAYPCMDELDYQSLDENNLDKFYDHLDLNRSITIPLFVGDDSGVKSVRDFTVEYFVPFNPKSDLNVETKNWTFLSGWDVLRWKLFGVRTDSSVTESISDFTAVSAIHNLSGKDNFPTNAKNPSWFGTVNCSDKNDEGSRYTTDISCYGYSVISQTQKKNKQFKDTIAEVFPGMCDNTQAREQYIYDADKKLLISDCYPIADFLDPKKHTLNYLTLTNFVNPAVFNKSVTDDVEQLARLYFRIELFDEKGAAAETVREYADITANGYSGNSKRSINVRIKRDSFMPVFNFALYSTYMDKEGKSTVKHEKHDENYWYGKEADQTNQLF